MADSWKDQMVLNIVRLRYGDIDHLVEPDPLAAAVALPGDEPVLLCTYTQFSALFRKYGGRDA